MIFKETAENMIDYKTLQRKKTEEIEEYHGSNGIQSDGRRQAAASHADAGDLPAVWRDG